MPRCRKVAMRAKAATMSQVVALLGSATPVQRITPPVPTSSATSLPEALTVVDPQQEAKTWTSLAPVRSGDIGEFRQCDSELSGQGKAGWYRVALTLVDPSLQP